MRLSKWLLLILAVLLAASMAACGEDEDDDDNGDNGDNGDDTTEIQEIQLALEQPRSYYDGALTFLLPGGWFVDDSAVDEGTIVFATSEDVLEGDTPPRTGAFGSITVISDTAAAAPVDELQAQLEAMGYVAPDVPEEVEINGVPAARVSGPAPDADIPGYYHATTIVEGGVLVHGILISLDPTFAYDSTFDGIMASIQTEPAALEEAIGADDDPEDMDAPDDTPGDDTTSRAEDAAPRTRILG